MSIFNVPQLTEEIWKDVIGFEGFYKVSNLGRVKSLNRSTCDGKQVKGHLLTPKGQRYHGVDLWKDGKGHNKLVHRLVAEAFVENPDSLPEVNHIDGDRFNNKASNLEWVSASVNHKHSVEGREGYSYRRSVKCLDTGEIFSSISAAGRSVNADATQIIESIDSKSCCKGQTFVYADSILENELEYLENARSKYQYYHYRPNMSNARKIEVIETGQVFDSMAETARQFNIDTATVTERIKFNRTIDGVTFRFLEGE